MKGHANSSESIPIKQKLHEETALIAWKELQRFFAQGVVMWVDNSCDLVEVGSFIAQDQAREIEALMASSKFMAVGDDQAKKWFDQGTSLWSLVVAPFVLVQEQSLQISEEKT